MALDQAKKAEIIAKYARGENDTGSTEVQVALITDSRSKKKTYEIS